MQDWQSLYQMVSNSMYFVADTGVNCLYLVNTNIFLNMNSPFDILFGTEVNIKQIFGTALVPRTYSR